VEVALARAGGNRARAARALGLSRQGLLKTLVRLGLDRTEVGQKQ
jgi:DNA-binding NtrC family response regulator